MIVCMLLVQNGSAFLQNRQKRRLLRRAITFIKSSVYVTILLHLFYTREVSLLT
ncbi:unnamed protein product [Brassica oleracea]